MKSEIMESVTAMGHLHSVSHIQSWISWTTDYVKINVEMHVTWQDNSDLIILLLEINTMKRKKDIKKQCSWVWTLKRTHGKDSMYRVWILQNSTSATFERWPSFSFLYCIRLRLCQGPSTESKGWATLAWIIIPA